MFKSRAFSIVLPYAQGYLIITSVVTAYVFSHTPAWTTWTLLVAMALYDLYAVLTPGGPLKVFELWTLDPGPTSLCVKCWRRMRAWWQWAVNMPVAWQGYGLVKMQIQHPYCGATRVWQAPVGTSSPGFFML